MGFLKDVAEKRIALMAEAERRTAERQRKRASKFPPKPRRNLAGTFVLSVLFGAIWQGTRGRRR